MPQAIAYPVENDLDYNANDRSDPVLEKWDRRTRMGPGRTGVELGRTQVTRWTCGTHEDLDDARLGWENMGAGCTSPGPVLYSVPCLVILLVFVATVINMEARKVDLNLTSLPPQAMLRHHVQAVAWHAAWCKARCRCQSNLAIGEGGGARLRMFMRLVRGQVSGPESGFTCSVDTNSLNCTSSWPNGQVREL